MILLLTLVVIAAAGSAIVPPLARWAQATMTPSTAVVLTTAASLAAAFGLGISLTALAIASLAGWGPIAREGHISTAMLRSLVEVPYWVGAAAALLVAALLTRAVGRTAVMLMAFWRSTQVCRNLAGADPVVFTDDADIGTAAGLPGRIIVGRRLFDELDDADQRVVIAHEHSHLRHRHHLYVQGVELAAAANPLLARVPAVVRLGVERWADEDAATTRGVAGRNAAARALARVAIARQRLHAAPASPALLSAAPGARLAVAALQVSTRVRALLEPAPRFRLSRTALIAAVAATALAAGLTGLAHVNDLIELAQVHPVRG